MLCDDWFPRNSAVEAMMAQQRQIEQVTQGALGYSRTLDHLLAQQRRLEELTARSTMADPMAVVMTQRLAEDAMRVTSAAETMRVSSLPEILSGSSLPEIWDRHPYLDPVLSGVARLRDDHRTLMELQHILSGHLTGVADLERALGPVMPERTFLA